MAGKYYVLAVHPMVQWHGLMDLEEGVSGLIYFFSHDI